MYDSAELDELKSYYNFIIAKIDAGQRLDSLNEDDLNYLRSLTESGYPKLSTLASSLINLNAAETHLTEVEYPIMESGRPKKEIKVKSVNNTYGLNIYPNPSSVYATINYKLEERGSEYSAGIYAQDGKLIQVLNLKGLEGQELIDTRKIPNGIYFISIRNKNNVIFSEQLIISH